MAVKLYTVLQVPPVGPFKAFITTHHTLKDAEDDASSLLEAMRKVVALIHQYRSAIIHAAHAIRCTLLAAESHAACK